MKFLLDHDVPDEAAQLLRYWGHDTQKLRDVLPITTPDERAFAWAQAQGCMIVSCNRNHFLALAQHAVEEGRSFGGLIILIRRRTRQAECAHLLALLRRAGETGLLGNVNFAWAVRQGTLSNSQPREFADQVGALSRKKRHDYEHR